jgi:hypothetical protein
METRFMKRTGRILPKPNFQDLPNYPARIIGNCSHADHGVPLNLIGRSLRKDPGMADEKFEMIYRNALRSEEGGCPRLNRRTEKAVGMTIDCDAAVPMRDGVRIYVDINRQP